MEIAERIAEIRERIETSAKLSLRKGDAVSLVAVSKTHGADTVRGALEVGLRAFGENRVQEAQGKWPELKADYPDVELHLIGPLQSNKTGDAVALFDVIQSVDRDKIASALAKEMKKQGRNLRFFVQVNTGGEPQKAGIAPEETEAFVQRCHDVHGLHIEGLMCIPPFDENPGPHFVLLKKLAKACGLEKLSMGMSSDYETAVELGATHVRVGSAIFGARDYA